MSASETIQCDDVAVGVVEVDANQAVDQPDEIVAAHKPSEPLGVVAEAQPARCLPDPAVGEGIQLVPGPLGLPKEDVHADVADALALLEQPALHRRITLRGAPEPAEIAAVSVDEKLGGIAQRRGGPLVVAGVAGLVQDAGTLLPGCLGHPGGCRPAPAEQRAGGVEGGRGPDARAHQQGHDQQPEGPRRRV